MRILRQRGTGGEYVERLLENELSRRSLTPPDRALCQELVYGIVRWEKTLDWLIARKTDDRKQNAGLRHLLQLGLYQLFWLQRIPNHAAVHETVELGKELGFGAQAGFLNAILRGYTRERETTVEGIGGFENYAIPRLGYSHPAWLVERWQARWGGAHTAQLLEWNNTPPPTFAPAESFENGFRHRNRGMAAGRGGIRGTALGLDGAEHGVQIQVASSPAPNRGSFQSGYFYVQDPSTLLAVKELDPQPHESILDLCAAPGGKTAFIAQGDAERGTENRRAGQPAGTAPTRCARTVRALALPACNFQEFVSSGGYDRILVDAPCSNTRRLAAPS